MKTKEENEKHAALLKSYIKFLSYLVHFKKSNLTLEEKKKTFQICTLFPCYTRIVFKAAHVLDKKLLIDSRQCYK